jgi:abortive infection bacteriophage resistance protein
LLSLFRSKPKPVVQTKQAAKKKSKKVIIEETQVMADVVKHLTEFFRLQEELAAKIRKEEALSRDVYDPTQNVMEAALNRVMALDQMAALEVTIRETMVYQAPPEMGALYSKVFEMRDVIRTEQEEARLAQEAKERYTKWQQRQAEQEVEILVAITVGVGIVAGYLHLWFLYLHK